jgi:hypothetical protein
VKIRELVERANEHDANPDPNIRWSNGPYDPMEQVLWEVGTGTTWTQWGVGVEINGESGGFLYPSRITAVLQFGPWYLYVSRQWRRKED